MAFRRWFRSRYPYRYSRYRRRYRRYRYGRKYVNSSSRSSVRMKTAVNYTVTATCGYGADATDAVVYGYAPYAGASLSATASPLFRTYTNLYEECKCIGMKVNIAIITPVGDSATPSIQIYTCWDRKYGNGEPRPTVASVKASATSNVATCLNNNVAKLTRSCYASDLMEKATWIDSTLDADNSYRNIAWYTAGLNPNMFCPSFQYFLNCPSLGATKAVDVSIGITYYFAFRNPRFGGASSSAKLQDLGERVVPRAVDDPGDADDPGLMAIDDLSLDDDIAADIESQRVPVTSTTSSRSTSSSVAARRSAVRFARDAARRDPNV